MKNKSKNLLSWQIFGIAFTIIAGTLLHFTYDWFNHSILVSLFSSINESTWEHMKLLFFPMFLFAIVESFFIAKPACFWKIKLIGTLLGLALIPILFYLYNGIIGKSPDWINISIFCVAAISSFLYEYNSFQKATVSCKKDNLYILFFLAIMLCFIIFTFYPPNLNIFKS